MTAPHPSNLTPEQRLKRWRLLLGGDDADGDLRPTSCAVHVARSVHPFDGISTRLCGP